MLVVAAAVGVGAVILLGGGVVLGVALALRFDAPIEIPRVPSPVSEASAPVFASESAPTSSYTVEEDYSYAFPDSASTVPEAPLYEPTDEASVVEESEARGVAESSAPSVAVEEPESPPASVVTPPSNVLLLIQEVPWLEPGREFSGFEPVTLADGLPADQSALVELIGPASLTEDELPQGRRNGFVVEAGAVQLWWTSKDAIRGERREHAEVAQIKSERGELRFAWNDSTVGADSDLRLLDDRRRLLNSLRLHVVVLTIGTERFYLPLMKPIPIEPIAIAPPGGLLDALPELDLDLPPDSLDVRIELVNEEAVGPLVSVDLGENGTGGSLRLLHRDDSGASIPLILCKYGIDQTRQESIDLKIETTFDFDYVPAEARTPHSKKESLWLYSVAEIDRAGTTLSAALRASQERLRAVTSSSRFGSSGDSKLEAELERQVEVLRNAQRIAALQGDLQRRLEAEPLRARVSVFADYSRDGEQVPPVTIFGSSVIESDDAGRPDSSFIFGEP
ncbi:MAG TPA: hypothetical protein VGN57_23145 [Pirellulaceae bacterium]|nr:hypothetical protein [Pirellulaceae bacterium]